MNVKVIGCSTTWTDRPTSSYCLDDDILIDCGEGTIKYYNDAKVDFFKIKNIFITHFHSDHFSGLVAYLCQYCIYNKDKAKLLSIYGPKGLKKHLELLKVFAFGEEDAKGINIYDFINVVELDYNSEIKLGRYTINTFELQHGNMLNMAYLFKDKDSTVGFSGDCTFNNELENFASKAKVCFLECCAEKTTENHLGCDKFLEIKAKYKDNRYIAVHCVDGLYENKKYDIEFAVCGHIYNFG